MSKYKTTWKLIDADSGWKYDFPKIWKPKDNTNLVAHKDNLPQWLIDNGYEGNTYGYIRIMDMSVNANAFFIEVFATYDPRGGLRTGQHLMNELYKYCPELYNQIVDEDKHYDCFNNDALVEPTMKFIVEQFNN